MFACKEGFDTAAEEEEDTCSHGADILEEEQSRTGINVTVRRAFYSEIQGNDTQQRDDIKFHSNAQ